jgi:predicted dehydrogenase
MALSRREFLGTSAAAATAATLGWSWASKAFAEDTADIRVAQIGLNGQGWNHVQATPECVVALCDVDQQVLANRAREVQELYGKKVDTYTDFRKLLERPDIDAVSIATPNHTHALLTVAAAQAGKHVYCEKPASHDLWEGRQMVQAARQYDRVIQCGTQNRSIPGIHEAVRMVQDGTLGKIQYAVGTCYKPRPSIGKLDQPLVIPSTIDYDLWCGPAEKRDLYRPHLHYDWHWDFNTGNGDLGNQGIHQCDVARWFLGEAELPPRVMSIGGRVGYDDAGNTPNTQVVYFDYEKAPLVFEVRGLPRDTRAREEPGDWNPRMDRYRGSQVGVIVQCERGYVFIPAFSGFIEAYDGQGKLMKQWPYPDDALVTHRRNWLAAVAANDPSQLNSEIAVGHVSSSLCHLGCISHQLGQPAPAEAIMEQVKSNDLLSNAFDRMASHLRANDVDIDSAPGVLAVGPWLELDPATQMFTNNDAANKLRQRHPQRAPFAVPDLERNGSAKAAATG